MTEQAGTAAEQPYLLISYEWHATLSDELRDTIGELTKASYLYDREAGFTDIPAPDAADDSNSGARHLVVYSLLAESDDADRTLAAYLFVDKVDEQGVGDGLFVVHPDVRSRGIATLLVEKLRADDSGEDWYGTGLSGLRMIVDGGHPAAERLAHRFGFPVTGERWLLIRMSRPGDPTVPAPERVGHFDVVEVISPAAVTNGVVRAIRPRPTDWSGRTLVERHYFVSGQDPDEGLVVRHGLDEDGRPDQLARIEVGPAVEALGAESIDAMFDLALGDVAARGARAVLADVLPADVAVVAVMRGKYFQHDQSNLTVSIDLS